MAGYRCVRRRADRDGPGRERLRRRAGRADAARDRDAGSRTGSTTWWFAAVRRLPTASRRWATSASRRRTPWACLSSRIPAGSFPRIALSRPQSRHERSRERSRWPRWRSRSSEWRRFRGPTTWAWRSPAIRWARTGSAGCRASGRRWPWSSGAAISASSRFRASWRARGG